MNDAELDKLGEQIDNAKADAEAFLDRVRLQIMGAPFRAVGIVGGVMWLIGLIAGITL
jgi:hypothetical protein